MLRFRMEIYQLTILSKDLIRILKNKINLHTLCTIILMDLILNYHNFLSIINLNHYHFSLLFSFYFLLITF